MFTGLVQTTGLLRTITPEAVQIAWGHAVPDCFVRDMDIGDSIAVDGICLTVTRILPDSFWAAVSPETTQRTILGLQQPNALVNLEASLRVGSKIGGHFVTGHIDGVGYLQSSTQTANAWEMAFTVPDERVARYIVPKGSVAINGISLTVADCNPAGSWFTVAVIPLTYAETNLRSLQPNSPVNLEGDVLGKYVEKFVRLGDSGHLNRHSNGHSTGHLPSPLHEWQVGNGEMTAPDRSSLTADFLAEHGYG
ncbi:MAG: riboflavin synthase [Cyanothece sp. SIO2G6]|nr:riboflavin synthase [Cyanothece sp. SIO2G6]